MSFRPSITNWFDRWSTRTLAEASACRSYARDVRYRIFEKRDEAACAAIYRTLEGGFPAGGFDGFRETLLRQEQSVVVAERAGRVVGMGGISLSGIRPRPCGTGWSIPRTKGWASAPRWPCCGCARCRTMNTAS